LMSEKMAEMSDRDWFSNLPLMRDKVLHFRPATSGDFQSVMAISMDIYQGLDYLPQVYNSWVLEGRVSYFRKIDSVFSLPSAKVSVYSTPEGYISKDIYILSYIQKSPKRIFSILFWSRIF
jgi:hypothetical protein